MAGATCVMATMAAAHAEAGTYHVLACSDLGSTSAVLPNNAWTQVPANAPTGLEAFVACPSMRGDRRDGIAAQDHIPGPSEVDAGDGGVLAFRRPARHVDHWDLRGALARQGRRPVLAALRARGRRRVRYLRHRVGPGRLREHGQRHLRDQRCVDDRLRRPLRHPVGPMHVRLEPARGVDVALRRRRPGHRSQRAHTHRRAERPVVERGWLPPGNRERQLRGHRQHGDRRGGLVRRRPPADL